ncbi:MAG: hypothetical protein PHY23_00400 [Oscillospiraceae bacterium]|nr:hypothetical protein [Oscillospiraceae bacterium]
MKAGNWFVAFTITVNGLQIDFAELSENQRIQILTSLLNCETSGDLFEEGHDEKAAS